jgi:hypothetical protein
MKKDLTSFIKNKDLGGLGGEMTQTMYAHVNK